MHKWLRWIVLIAIAVVGYMLILAWQKDYATPKQPPAMPQSASSSTPASSVSGNTTAPPATSTTASATPATSSSQTAGQQLITVTTDLLNLRIDPKGGDIVGLSLLKYPVSVSNKDPLIMFDKTAYGSYFDYFSESGLIGANGTHNTSRPVYSSNSMSYSMNDSKTLDIPLTYTDSKGVQYTKTYHFEHGKYPVRVTYSINNTSDSAWSGQMYSQLLRNDAKDPTAYTGGMALSTYLGGVWSDKQHSYNKLKFSDFQSEPLNQTTTQSWVGISQHYFVSAWIPDPTQTNQLISRTVNGLNVITALSPNITVQPGETGTLNATLFAGPKIQTILNETAPNLEKTVDYGIFWPIARPLFIALKWLDSILGNWGWAIVGLTILVRLLMYPLSAASYKSMAKMKVVAPQLQKLKDEFGDDRMKMSQAMMELYRKEQVNPLAGCLPMLLQMPIFLSLYWVLVESVELRQAPWILWIKDLSVADPYFILPILFGVTMYIQQLLNPQPTDPAQAKIMRLLPIIFTVMFLFFPAGLVLYWLVSNIITIIQQLVITKKIESDYKKRNAPASA